jgi:hypothetical protein
MAALTTEPRSFGVMAFTAVLCGIELVAGLFALNVFLRSRSNYKPSAPVMARSAYLVAGWAFLMLAGTVIYWAIRDNSNPRDMQFYAVMGVVTILTFIVLALTWGWDLMFERAERPMLEKREEHRQKSVALQRVVSRIRLVRVSDGPTRQQIETITKRLDTASTQLAHSHGGGVGSYDGQQRLRPDPQAETDIDEAASVILAHLEYAAQNGEPALRERLADIERGTAVIESAVRTLQLA